MAFVRSIDCMKVGLGRHSHKSQNQKDSAEDTWSMDLGASVGSVVDVEAVAEGKDLDKDLVGEHVEQAEHEDLDLEFLPKDQIQLQTEEAAVEEQEVVDTAVGYKVVV